MKSTELLALLRDFSRDKLAIRQRHVAVAKHVPDYDFNNTYQYVIAREDVQVNWLRDAIADLGGSLEDVPEPTIQGSAKSKDLQTQLIADDKKGAQDFVDKWRTRIEAMPNARHRFFNTSHPIICKTSSGFRASSPTHIPRRFSDVS